MIYQDISFSEANSHNKYYPLKILATLMFYLAPLIILLVYLLNPSINIISPNSPDKFEFSILIEQNSLETKVNSIAS